MPRLILLNGPPASGKSTLAARFCDTRPFMLNLDVDVIRSLLGSWQNDPHAAGLAARRIALAMVDSHLDADDDVIVPQFLARETFALQLKSVADSRGAEFVEVALRIDRADAIAAFARRRAAPEVQRHLDADVLVDRSANPDPIGAMHGDYERFIAGRPSARIIEVEIGNIEATLEQLEDAVETGRSGSGRTSPAGDAEAARV